jgi:hypothetical protein
MRTLSSLAHLITVVQENSLREEPDEPAFMQMSVTLFTAAGVFAGLLVSERDYLAAVRREVDLGEKQKAVFDLLFPDPRDLPLPDGDETPVGERNPPTTLYLIKANFSRTLTDIQTMTDLNVELRFDAIVGWLPGATQRFTE